MTLKKETDKCYKIGRENIYKNDILINKFKKLPH